MRISYAGLEVFECLTASSHWLISRIDAALGGKLYWDFLIVGVRRDQGISRAVAEILQKGYSEANKHS